jgi:HAD superfamily hydrolase (TIGR01509 family)
MSTPRNSSGSFDLVVFDCDGVLVDSEVIACRATAEALQAIGQTLSVESIGERFLGFSQQDMYTELEAERGAKLPPDFDVDMNRRAAALFERELRPMAGLERALAQLPMAKCVASSSMPHMLARKLGWTGLGVWFGDDVFSTALVARGKPAPDIFNYAAAKMSTAPARALVIEDSASGILAAKAAGMTAFGFTGGSHCRPGHGDRLAAAGADLVFADMLVLPQLVADAAGGSRAALSGTRL